LRNQNLAITSTRLTTPPASHYTYPMLSRDFSCAVIGLDGVVVEVEVDTTNGLPGMDILGSKDLKI
jgi:hypothetical protein